MLTGSTSKIKRLAVSDLLFPKRISGATAINCQLPAIRDEYYIVIVRRDAHTDL